ncbi:hypothetical protein PM082_012209 [Marasmius tenuissimus]|nr:hypothetical protein PM082_012209 [Marasmius tenuissimus]
MEGWVQVQPRAASFAIGCLVFRQTGANGSLHSRSRVLTRTLSLYSVSLGHVPSTPFVLSRGGNYRGRPARRQRRSGGFGQGQAGQPSPPLSTNPPQWYTNVPT